MFFFKLQTTDFISSSIYAKVLNLPEVTELNTSWEYMWSRELDTCGEHNHPILDDSLAGVGREGSSDSLLTLQSILVCV